jgi:hypothetical protein
VLPLPQAAGTKLTISSNAQTIHFLRRFLSNPAPTKHAATRKGRQAAYVIPKPLLAGRAPALSCVARTVSVVVPLGVTELGETLHVNELRAPTTPQVTATVPVNPATGAKLTTSLACPPHAAVRFADAVLTVKSAVRSNLAVTALSPSIVNEQASPLHAPPQPLKVEPAAGVAANCTVTPSKNVALQALPQSSAGPNAGPEVTVPLPAPAFATVTRCTVFAVVICAA